MRYPSNARVIKAFKLVDKINIGDNTKYNFEEVFIDFDLSEIDEQSKNPSYLADLTFSSLFADITSDFNQFYDPCVDSKSTKTILQKNIIPTSKKLQRVYIDL